MWLPLPVLVKKSCALRQSLDSLAQAGGEARPPIQTKTVDFPMELANFQSLLGLGVMILIAWALSENRRAFDWKLVSIGAGLQVGIAALLLGVPFFRAGLMSLNAVVDALQQATQAGTSMVFGYVGGGDVPFEVTNPSALMIFGFQALPMLLVLAALTALLWHWGILKAVVRGFAFALQKTMGLGGAVGVGCAANIFVGMTEAPLLIRAYLTKLSRSELFVIMTTGLATIAGTVLVVYATILDRVIEGAVGHILTASIISLPAAIIIAKVMIPGDAVTDVDDIDQSIQYDSSFDAVTRGTQDGLRMLLNIIAMLIVMVSLVALVNVILTVLPNLGGEPITLQRMLGWVFAPFVWTFGIPWAEAGQAGALMGTKTILNEFIAYIDLANLQADALSERSRTIMLYALCGFANFGSVGIMVAGFVTLAPERRADILELGPKALISGTLATSMTGAAVGLIL